MRKIKLLSISLVLLLVMGALPMSASAAELPFTDVGEKAWYRSAVEYAYENGLFNGTSNTTFSPDSGMTRAMFVQVLANATENYNKNDYPTSSFTDVPAGKWYTSAVAWANDVGIVSGVGNNRYAPEDLVTREQMARIMYTYAAKTKNDTAFSDLTFEAFPDKDSVASWGKEPIQWAVDKKVINGSREGATAYLKPKKTATRAEVAQVLMNAKDILINRTIDKNTVPDNPTPDVPDPDLTDIPEADQFLFKGKTTAETVIEKETTIFNDCVILPPEAPQKTKVAYTTHGGKTGTKYAAPSDFPEMQKIYNSCDILRTSELVGKYGITQEKVDVMSKPSLSYWINVIDIHTSAQWGNISGVGYYPAIENGVYELDRYSVSSYSRGEILLTGQTTETALSSSGEAIGYSLEKQNARYYSIKIIGIGKEAEIAVYYLT